MTLVVYKIILSVYCTRPALILWMCENSYFTSNLLQGGDDDIYLLMNRTVTDHVPSCKIDDGFVYTRNKGELSWLEITSDGINPS